MSPRRIFIDEARPADIDVLVAIDERCAPHPWPAKHFRPEMDPGNRARVLVLRELDPAGSVVVVGFCAYRLVVDEVHVHNLAVVPERRRHGLARRLLRTVLEAAVRQNARWAMLEVRAGNAPARRLYESEGFTVAGERRRYYQEPVEDAVVLRRTL